MKIEKSSERQIVWVNVEDMKPMIPYERRKGDITEFLYIKVPVAGGAKEIDGKVAYKLLSFASDESLPVVIPNRLWPSGKFRQIEEQIDITITLND